MVYLIVSLICLAASAIGAAVGIGGGVIIKPVLDSLRIMDVKCVSFLSGITVLCMSTYSVVKGKLSHDTRINLPMAVAVSVGAAIGGIVGKTVFSRMVEAFSDSDLVGAAQSVCLFLLTIVTLIYSVLKRRIPTFRVRSFPIAAAAGLVLGVFSSFLGIGGGPINIMFLCVLFSFGTKSAAAYSLFIIMCSQASSLIWQIVSGTVPEFSVPVLALMAVCGILGGVIGTQFRKKMKPSRIDVLFIVVLVVIMCVCVYNYFGYAGILG